MIYYFLLKFRKAIEISKLMVVKCHGILSQLDETTKVVLSIHIACELMNIPVDTKSAVQLKKSQYNKYKKTILKLLGLDKTMTIDEVIRKLGITHATTVERTAKEIFSVYVKQEAFEDVQDFDVSIFVMSVYFACKFENVKILKKNIIILSNLRPNQWVLMEQSWEKWVSSLKKITNKENRKIVHVQENDHVASSSASQIKESKTEETEESYEIWEYNTLVKAYKELQQKFE